MTVRLAALEGETDKDVARRLLKAIGAAGLSCTLELPAQLPVREFMSTEWGGV